MQKGDLVGLATVLIDIDGIEIILDGVQVRMTSANFANHRPLVFVPPKFRTYEGASKPAVGLPDERNAPLGRAVIDRCEEIGLVGKLIA